MEEEKNLLSVSHFGHNLLTFGVYKIVTLPQFISDSHKFSL